MDATTKDAAAIDAVTNSSESFAALASAPASATADVETAAAAKSAVYNAVTTAVPVAMDAATISSNGQFSVTATFAANTTASNAALMGMSINDMALATVDDAPLLLLLPL